MCVTPCSPQSDLNLAGICQKVSPNPPPSNPPTSPPHPTHNPTMTSHPVFHFLVHGCEWWVVWEQSSDTHTHTHTHINILLDARFPVDLDHAQRRYLTGYPLLICVVFCLFRGIISGKFNSLIVLPATWVEHAWCVYVCAGSAHR